MPPSHKPFDLPPLGLIEGFEAAARTLSFTLAAKELFLTQSAISRQIKTLEDRLGVPLFERRTRALRLTDPGERLYATVTTVLQRLQETTRELRARPSVHVFTVTTTPSFASLWLIPRLVGYTGTHPHIDVRISASNEVLDLERSGIEIAIRYSGPQPATGAIKLFNEEVFPVCSPSLLEGQRVRSPADLARYVFLHYENPAHGTPWLDWSIWLQAMGLQGLKPAGALYFNQYDQMVSAAVNGQGIALGRSPLLKGLLKKGQLVAPLSTRSAVPRAYYLIQSSHAAGRAEVQQFIEWVRCEAREGNSERGGSPTS